MEPIAFIGNDRQLYVLDAPEGVPRRLTAEAATSAYTWPTWAPGRDALAVMHHSRGDRAARSGVALCAVEDGPPRRVWTAQSGGPVYLYWAPDGRHLGLLVQEADNLHLLVADRAGGRVAAPLVSGAPLYWSWASDGGALVVHVGGHYRLGGDARVLLVRLAGARPAAETLSTRPLGFRAPACEPGTARVAYAAASQADRRVLLLADTGTGRVEELAAVGDEPAFVWAPRGGRLAVADERSDAGLYESLMVVDADAGTAHRLSRAVVAFYWTPAGDALICAVPDATGGALAWERLDLTSGTAHLLAGFTPTPELALLLGHFDQYAQSVCLYSREEPTLLFAHTGEDARHDGRSAKYAALWLATGEGPARLRHLAGGSIGFFAP